ncbi:peptidoglycan-binding protein [Orenia metallireducens]|uniref:Peptidoglycan-binding protein n=1 Tax=Orenia metallireducens TaxID=1413210 RepID=A0A1C0A6M6_9FIRM|nr:SPOCS domain-containing protein [Orenia metallireducens]OCL25763.1 peptidoglycan-binding protein [Orenia metallireducens]
MAINFKEEQVRVEYVIGEDTVRESITKEVPIPVAEKPDIERILEVSTKIESTEVTVEEGGVTIDGVIEVGVMYVADTAEGDQPVHYFHGEMTFTNFVDIPEAEDYMSAYVDVDILRSSYDFVDERTVEVTVVLKKFAKVFDYRQMNIITDVTGIREELVEKELLRIENVVGENTYQVVVEGIIDVPTVKPPIERVLKVEGGALEDKNVEITDGAVIVDGEFEVGVMYVADTTADETPGTQPVHFFEGGLTFSEVIDVPDADEDMTSFTDINVKRWDYTITNGNRQVEVRAILEVFVKVTEPKQVMVVTGIDSDRVELEEELLRVEEVIGEDTVTETVTEDLIVPDVKPNIERILETNAQLSNTTCIVEDGGVVVTSEGEGSVLYVADTTADETPGTQPVHYFQRPFNIENFINIPEAEAGMSCHSNIEIKKVKGNRLNNRTVELVVTLRKFAKVTNFRQLTIVTDIVVVSPVVDRDECERPSKIIYVVQAGDTLYKIARRYRTTVDAIVDANNLDNPDYLEVGQKLIIPRCIIDDRDEPRRPRG